MHSDEADVYLSSILYGQAPLVLTAGHVRQLLARGDVLVNEHDASGPAAGLVWADDGALHIQKGGRFCVRSILPLSQQNVVGIGQNMPHKPSLRSAQFLCGVVGLLMINALVYFDRSNRMPNIKDFTINYASDMLAVGSILLMAEWFEDHRRKRRDAEQRHELIADAPHVASSSGLRTVVR